MLSNKTRNIPSIIPIHYSIHYSHPLSLENKKVAFQATTIVFIFWFDFDFVWGPFSAAIVDRDMVWKLGYNSAITRL